MDEPLIDTRNHVPGISLRDWFAGMAMQGFISNPTLCTGDNWSEDSKVVAEQAYAVAENMLMERAK